MKDSVSTSERIFDLTYDTLNAPISQSFDLSTSLFALALTKRTPIIIYSTANNQEDKMGVLTIYLDKGERSCATTSN
eukprot:scaffold3924_cov132-Skeletonema_marinoi.AAC.3